jgi:hypothetical protein
MAVFDSYIMIDWSGGARRRGDKADAIWIAHGPGSIRSPDVHSPYSRTEAYQFIRCLLDDLLDKSHRVLVSFDFAYGYPANFAAGLPTSTGLTSPSWKIVWDYLHDSLKDDDGTEGNRAPTNKSNRFELANQINLLMSLGAAPGPFWCTPRSGLHARIPQDRPTQPFKTAQGRLIRAQRLTDACAGGDTPFRLFGAGSVGSQVLTGIPRLFRLRYDPGFASVSSVWPFETGWAVNESWLDDSNLPECERISPGFDQGSRTGHRNVGMGARTRPAKPALAPIFIA